MFELQLGLWVVEPDGGRIALQLNRFDAEIRRAPHLVQNHLSIGRFQNLRDSYFRHPEDLVFPVISKDSVHLFKIDYVACANGFRPVYP